MRLLSLLFLCFSSLAHAQPIGTQAKWGQYLLQYADPVDTYPHGVFGEPIEPTTILDLGEEAYFTAPLEPLPQGYVFEDRLPRFVDMEGDGEPELLTIVTNPSAGAAVWLWSRNGKVRAKSAFHGRPNRWLNPVLGSADLDGDGNQELAIIRTPHIGAVLEILDENDGNLDVGGYEPTGIPTNHRFGDPRLATSYLCQSADGRNLILISATIDSAPETIEIFELGTRRVNLDPKYRLPQGLNSQFDFLALSRACSS